MEAAGDQIDRLDHITNDNPSLQRPINALRCLSDTRRQLARSAEHAYNRTRSPGLFARASPR